MNGYTVHVTVHDTDGRPISETPTGLGIIDGIAAATNAAEAVAGLAAYTFIGPDPIADYRYGSWQTVPCRRCGWERATLRPVDAAIVCNHCGTMRHDRYPKEVER